MDTLGFLKDIYVSKYLTAKTSVGSAVSLVDELRKIRSGHYSELINPCRKAYKENESFYRKLKSHLPALTFCGVFEGGHKKENLIVYNNIIVIDIDHIPEDDIAKVKSKLFSDEYVFACWISPSGRGLKLLIRINSTQVMHKFCFDRILDHLFASYEIEADISGCDVSRLCYISCDEDLLLKEESLIFPMQDDEWLISLMSEENRKIVKGIANKSERNQTLYTESEKILFYKTEGRNNTYNRDLAKKILMFLKKSNQSITKSYSDWVKVALAIANAFTYDIGFKIYMELCRLDGSFHDEYKSEYLLQYCYRKRKPETVNFGSIVYLAIQKGFIVAPIKRRVAISS